MESLRIILKGIPPSKKNSKRIFLNKRTGARFIASSASHGAWHEEMMWTLKSFSKPTTGIVECLSITFYPPDKRRHDSTNVAESINDLLVDAGIIEDDSWFVLPDIRLKFGEIDKKNPRVEIEISLSPTPDEKVLQ